jgi:uncharacterized protein (TIGR04222 family)
MEPGIDLALLLAYGLWGLAINLLLRAWLRRPQPGLQAGAPVLSDPYEIAALRGGADEVVRVAAFALALRGQARVTDGRLEHAGEPFAGLQRQAVERAVLEACRTTACSGAQLLGHPAAQAGARAVLATLHARGLLAPEALRPARRRAFLLAALLLAVPAIPLLLRFFGGEGGVLGAVGVLAPAAAGFAWQAAEDMQTAAAVRMLGALDAAHSPLLEGLARAQLTRDETVLAAALYGLAALPAQHYPQAAALFPPPPPDPGAAAAG